MNKKPEIKQDFNKYGLKTNTTKSEIDLDLVLSGGPGKDGIPAINNPKFLNIKNAEEAMIYLEDDSRGMLVTFGNDTRFYPLEILVWHEIVNDEIGDKKISITFCPLCGSSIVYDRNINGKELVFGVSGLLYESNLLMYDKETESLWSQSLGKAVVGDYSKTKLKVYKSDLITFAQFRENYPNGLVLSDDTGFSRSYGIIPYGDYDENDTLYFSVQNSDSRFHKKEIFYIVNDLDTSIAFLFKDLKSEKKAEIKVGDNIYNASYNNGIIEVRKNDIVLPGYFEMWFSWVNHNTGNKNIWSK